MQTRRHHGQLVARTALPSASMIVSLLAMVMFVLFWIAWLGSPHLLVGALVVTVVLFLSTMLRAGMHRLGVGYRVAAAVTPTELELSCNHGMANEKDAVYPRTAFRSGHVVPWGESAVVVLRGRHRERLRIRFDDIVHAREFIHELGFSPRARPMTFAFFFNLHVTVGVDGVLVALPVIGRKRFVPHESIVDIRQSSTRVTLVLKDGSTFEIATGGGEQHAAFVERLVEATQAYVDAEHVEPLSVLRQSGRTPSAWVKELRAMMESGGTGYRTATVPEDTLWCVALDPSEPPEHRIGAGLALRAKLDDDGRARLRVAAGAAASPRVRVALEATADEPSDEMLAEVLARA